jgi:hypothetical protein
MGLLNLGARWLNNAQTECRCYRKQLGTKDTPINACHKTFVTSTQVQNMRKMKSSISRSPLAVLTTMLEQSTSQSPRS